ncbi:hypothetical protein BSKO_12867 [Bryopsis sp. KO-2023]|nr:hypothetical protein BSKO_12867 [Bryopsis sp. KO-2023]
MTKLAIALFCLALASGACAQNGRQFSGQSFGFSVPKPQQFVVAQCTLKVGSARGVLSFSQIGNGPTMIKGFVSNVTPGKHGWHVHEFAVSNGDCATAGGHFNPDGVPHGDRTAAVRHVGDLGNFLANKKGVAPISLQDDIISLTGPADRSIIGRSIVIHGGVDDLGLGGDAGSVASGNSGARVGCCTINKVI